MHAPKFNIKFSRMVQSLKLNSGYSIPAIGLGTWQSKPGEVAAAIKTAVAAGYRHIDCAHVYQNQKEVGEALKEILDEGKVKVIFFFNF